MISRYSNNNKRPGYVSTTRHMNNNSLPKTWEEPRKINKSTAEEDLEQKDNNEPNNIKTEVSTNPPIPIEPNKKKKKKNNNKKTEQ